MDSDVSSIFEFGGDMASFSEIFPLLLKFLELWLIQMYLAQSLPMPTMLDCSVLRKRFYQSSICCLPLWEASQPAPFVFSELSFRLHSVQLRWSESLDFSMVLAKLRDLLWLMHTREMSQTELRYHYCWKMCCDWDRAWRWVWSKTKIVLQLGKILWCSRWHLTLKQGWMQPGRAD